MIGLEVHVEPRTVTKMFCRCLNAPFGAEPNEHTCPICMGLPGTLPVPNREAVRKTIIVGMALGSEISRFSKFDRKHYFYPDLPKGYQISQYDLPFCVGGELTMLDAAGQPESAIRFERVHLEEDAGKLLHTGRPGYSRVDLNRAGVPLMEMVTKPDLTSPEQARRFMQELRLLMRTLDVSDADMEKGQMRCDVNVSILIEENGQTINTPITEIKNVNSTRAVERSLIIEAQRQYDEWMANGPIRKRKNKLTAGWDEDAGAVQINRAKEAAHEYRYFPEPDIPPLAVYELPELNPQSVVLPELPNARRQRYLKDGLPSADIEVLLQNPDRLDKYEELRAAGLPAKTVATWLVNTPDSIGLMPDRFAELLRLVDEGSIAAAVAKQRLPEIVELIRAKTAVDVLDAGRQLDIVQQHDESMVQLAIAEVLAEQPAAVADYRAGKEKIIGFLVGQVMQKCKGKAQASKVQEALKQELQ
ncbi:Asp-tRNA(Asn)/Glu-tRNA(Gln) amidotransferase subunit GatB [Patescibacteria group bacterium]|nr:Asp-tRNA(Asn)/Glu-tRNA(Gln) amidotransferase subunit GatB [Patescibacteria group bacterium]